jgi:hypothetical protein
MTVRHGDIDASVHDANPIDTGRLAAAWPQSGAAREILANIVDASASPAAAVDVPRHRRRTVLIAAAALTTVALLLAGWSAYQGSNEAPALSERTDVFGRGLPDLVVHCALPGGKEGIYYGDNNAGDDPFVADPVRYCAEEDVEDLEGWRGQGLEPPDMAAYRNASGEVEVVPADRDVPSSWRPYTYEPVALAVLELETSLIDYVDGLQSDCFDPEGGRAFVEQELRRLGLEGWQVTVRDVAAGSAARGCAGALPHFDDKEIEVVPGLDAGAGEHPFKPLADRVRRTLGRQCLTLEKAASKVISLNLDYSRATGLIPDGKHLRPYEFGVVEHVDAEADCTRADMSYNAPWLEVVLRGPKA